MRKITLLFLILSSFCGAVNAQMTSRVVKDNLFIPWELIYGPDGHIWFTQKNGYICRINPVSGVTDTLYHETNTVVKSEGGMLGMALHPDFSNNPQVFVAYNYEQGGNYKQRIVRYSYANNVLQSPVIILDNINAANIHNGCRLAIVNNMLYISTGDASSASIAQDPTAINGKVLRINLDGSIPTDNPISGSPVWSWGHRNIQGMVYANNRLYASEHGNASDDEINILEQGRNFGWPDVQGYCNTNAEKTFCTDNNVAEPIEAWTPTLAVCGIDHYDHPMFPALQKSLLMTTLKDAKLYQLKLNADGSDITSVSAIQGVSFGRLRDICISPEGRIYISTSNSNSSGTGGFTDKIIELYDPAYNHIDDISADGQDITIYPNPASNDINVDCKDISKYPLSYMITNLQGQLLLNGTITSDNRQIVITSLPYGDYLIRLSSGEKTIVTQKIAKR